MIAVFGASVTQQKKGYAIKLKKKFHHPVQIFGYPGMHLYNAGICFIDKVLKCNPSYCFIDWFSTAYNATDEKTIEYIDTIIHKFSKKQCKLIFLFLPFKDNPEKVIFHSFCKQYLKSKKIFYIDLNSEINKNDLNDILKDTVHTTDYGSSLYANIIYDKFNDMKGKIIIPRSTHPTKYDRIKAVSVNRIFNKNIIINGTCEIIGFLLTIGPHSGIVEISNGKDIERYNTWDRWCHYPRRHFNLQLKINGITKINILQEEFDTSSCKQEYNFQKEEKKLIIHDIFYIGKKLEIINLCEGKKINKINKIIIFSKKIMGRIGQYKSKLKKQLLK